MLRNVQQSVQQNWSAYAALVPDRRKPLLIMVCIWHIRFSYYCPSASELSARGRGNCNLILAARDEPWRERQTLRRGSSTNSTASTPAKLGGRRRKTPSAPAQPGRSHGRQRARSTGIQVFPAPAPHQVEQTIPIKRQNKAVKRCADVVENFPNEASTMRLIDAVLFEQNRQWQNASRYLMVEAFLQIDKEEVDPILSTTTKAA